MWQFYALLAIVFNCLEDVTDKRAMGRCNTIDTDAATFIRVILYCLLVTPMAVLFGYVVSWYCSPGIIVFGFASSVMASAYTVVLKRVNITTLSILGYVAPLIFLAIDSATSAAFSLAQILGILGLVVGGIGFALSDKLEFDKPTLAALAFMLTYGGAEFYYVKWMQKTEGLNAISVFANTWMWAAIFLFALLILQRKIPLLLTRQAVNYAKSSSMAKLFEAVTSVMWSAGIALTTVAQFSSMEVFFPPIMLAFALMAQAIFGVNLGESIERKTIARKVLMVAILVVSGIFV
jgi:hypothetical protein